MGRLLLGSIDALVSSANVSWGTVNIPVARDLARNILRWRDGGAFMSLRLSSVVDDRRGVRMEVACEAEICSLVVGANPLLVRRKKNPMMNWSR